MKTRLFLTSFSVIFLLFQAFAIRFETGSDIRITEAIHEDIYVFGGSIYIDAPVFGDLWCAGGSVTINDTIHGDLVVAGGNITLRGTVLDDLRAAGGTLLVTGLIVGDMLIAGGNITVESSASIGGDLAMSGGTVTINSDVQGKVKASGGTVYLNGEVGENLEFNGGKLTLNGTVGGPASIAATRLNIGDKAALHGNVRYWTDSGEVEFGNTLQEGAIATFDPSLHKYFERPDSKLLGFASIMAVLWYLVASFILIVLGQWLFPKTLHNAAKTAASAPMHSLGYGFIYFAAVPVGIILLFLTLVAIPVGMIALFFYIMFFALANVIAALIAAHWINSRKNYNWSSFKLAAVALGLLVVLKLLAATPFLGWIILIAVIFIAFGSILDNTGIFRRRPSTV